MMSIEEQYIEWIQNIINGYKLGQTYSHKTPNGESCLRMIKEVIEKYNSSKQKEIYK